MQSVYKVPVLPQNLRKEETIVQIAESLNYLQEVSNDIFMKVNNRIKENEECLLEITNRIKETSNKISKISGAKKAIQVFSNSKYPGTDVNKQFISIFNDKNIPHFKKFLFKYKNQFIKDQTEAIQFFHVKNPVAVDNDFVGLGEMSRNIVSLNDLLLYNSGKNLYIKYTLSETLKVLQQLKKEMSDTHQISAAPSSISDKIKLAKSTDQDYFYIPNLGDVPTLDVPLDLPDLPGIADDLRYVSTKSSGIAPSVTVTLNMPDLQKLELLNKPDSNKYIERPEEFSEEDIVVKASFTSNNNSVLSKETPVVVIRKIEEAVDEKNNDLHVKSETNNDELTNNLTVNVHNSLMEAIRNAGGSQNAKLKRIKQRENKKESSVSKIHILKYFNIMCLLL